MALLNVNFYSKSLMRSVCFNAIIPVDKMLYPVKSVQGERKVFKTLYFCTELQ